MEIDGKHFRDVECNCWDPNQRIQECNRDNVSIQGKSTLNVK